MMDLLFVNPYARPFVLAITPSFSLNRVFFSRAKLVFLVFLRLFKAKMYPRLNEITQLTNALKFNSDRKPNSKTFHPNGMTAAITPVSHPEFPILSYRDR